MKLEEQRELTPLEILQSAINDYNIDSFYVAYSGGKDSGIALDYVSHNFSKQFKGVIFVNTGIATKATVEFVKDYCKKHEEKYIEDKCKPHWCGDCGYLQKYVVNITHDKKE